MKSFWVWICLLLTAVLWAQIPNPPTGLTAKNGGQSKPLSVLPQAYPPGSSSVTVEQGTREPFSVAGGVSVTWSVDNIVGGNSTVGTISSAGFYKAPTANGTHKIQASDGKGGAGTATVTVSGTLPSYSCAWNKGLGSAGDTMNCTMAHDGLTRLFSVHIPSGFNPGTSSVIFALSGTDVDQNNYCWQTGSGNESTGLCLFSDSISTTPPMVISPLGLRVPTRPPATGPGWHSYSTACSSFTGIAGQPCPNDSDFIRQLILAADKQNNLNLKQVMIVGQWTEGAPMALRAAVEIGDLISSVALLETNWRNPAGDTSQTLDVTQGTYPVSVLDIGESATSAPNSMDFCGAHPTSTDPIAYSADDMVTYWNITDGFTSFDTGNNLCNGYNGTYGVWSGLFSKKGMGGILGTEIQLWNLKGAINKDYCSPEGQGTLQKCTPIINFNNSTCSSITPCNPNMTVASGLNMNMLIENFRETHVKP